MALRPLRVLSLCSGIGALDIALELAVPSARSVCYVEREAYNVEALAARMADGSIPSAPVWDDVRTFDGRGWRGAVDLVLAGFPCQPVSVAGKRERQEDERWIWPDVARIVREVRPRLVFLENVAGIIFRDSGFDQVLGALALLGFDAEWTCVRASDVGAPQIRSRIFVLAHSNDGALRDIAERSEWRSLATVERDTVSAYAGADLGRGSRTPPQETASLALSRRDDQEDVWPDDALWPPGPRWRGRWRPGSEPVVRRDADGISDRLDRIRASGGAVVPLAAAYAFVALANRVLERPY